MSSNSSKVLPAFDLLLVVLAFKNPRSIKTR